MQKTEGTQLNIDQFRSFNIYKHIVYNGEVYITASLSDKNADPISTFSDVYITILDYLSGKKLNMVSERIFGSTRFYDAIVKARSHILQSNGTPDLPFTYIQGQPCWGNGIAGIQITAVASDCCQGVSTIYDNDIPIGRRWERNGSIFLSLQNIYDSSIELKQSTNAQQACLMFEAAKRILNENSASYKNVIRTWIYLSDILAWYHEFNKVRNAKYGEFGFLSDHSFEMEKERIWLPASTGILGCNAHGAAAVMDILAVVPTPGSSLNIKHSSGLKQRSPFHYGSAFSRAVSIYEPQNTTILLSGTASIDREGNTVCIGDVRAQIIKTFEIVDALISEEGASLKNICTATIFLKRSEDYSLYKKTIEEMGLKNIPAVCIIADVCRQDLLFEIDAAFAVPNSSIGPQNRLEK